VGESQRFDGCCLQGRGQASASPRQDRGKGVGCHRAAGGNGMERIVTPVAIPHHLPSQPRTQAIHNSKNVGGACSRVSPCNSRPSPPPSHHRWFPLCLADKPSQVKCLQRFTLGRRLPPYSPPCPLPTRQHPERGRVLLHI